MSEMTYVTYRDEQGNTIKVPEYAVDVVAQQLRYFRQEYKDGERILDPWQRLDGWSGKDKENYKADFIKAILCNKDIPKIMEYTLKGDPYPQKQRILDGGHRTRAIDEFMKGLFPVKLGENYYFWEADESRPSRKGSGHNLILPRQLKDKFNKYPLTVTTYFNLTDEQAREKFNDLNHCSPMKVHEVINSHASLLIDKLRDLWVDVVGSEESEEYKNIRKIFSLSKSDLESLKYMKVLISLFSLVERKGKSDEFNYCQPSDALYYTRAKEDDGLHTQFNTEDFEVEWSKFTDAMDKYRDWFGNFTSEVEVEDGEDTPYIWEPHNHSEALSVFHLYNSVEFETDDAEKLRVFFERCHNYRKKSTKIEKDIKKKVMKNKDITELQTELIALQDNLGSNVVDWMKTFKNNGSGPSNMKKRNETLRRVLGR